MNLKLWSGHKLASGSVNRADFFKFMKSEYKKCLDPTMRCEQRPIRAHSVQNATALSFIENDNHVYQMKMKVQDEKLAVDLQLIGRNQASTFKGLCKEHDNEIFKPIDTQPIDENCPEQLFLIAYRSVTRELYATLDGATKIQSAYLTMVARGDVPKGEPSPAGMEAYQHMLKAWAMWKYRFKYYDLSLVNKDYRKVRHVTFSMDRKVPSVASSSFFSLDFKPWGKPFAALVVNIIPTSPDRTLVVFSFAVDHRAKAVEYFSKILRAKGVDKEYELSCMLLDRAENFFLSPSIVDGWSEVKRLEIISAFAQDFQGPNPFSNDPLVRTSRLNLFETPRTHDAEEVVSQ